MSYTPQPAPKDTAGDPGSVVVFPGTHEYGRPPNNLPAQLTSFVGRERQVAEVDGLLADRRLLTLTGPGGSGKTRLAMAVAFEVLDDFEDGVWLVQLASLSAPNLVPQAVAQAVGVREEPGREIVDNLVEHLESKEMLVVLDNCEHLIDACAVLAYTLLRSCPGVRILATSREALGVDGESTWPVPPLSLPDSEHQPAFESLTEYEAIRLFVERAKGVAPAFALTEQNAPAVAKLCRRLEGIPLAIELAAARVRVLSVEQISSRLEKSFALLAGSSRTADPRQRTLRAAIDWSYDLLPEEERVLLRRQSVFAGGFTLEAAEEVCSGEGIEKEMVLDLLSHLLNKSLVLMATRNGETRYRLLETVRQYGAQKLEESGESAQTRRRHADFFLELIEQVEPNINGRDRGVWLERLELENDNLRAALAWSTEQEAETETGLRLTAALLWFWFHQGYWSEGRAWLHRALTTQASTGRPARTSARAKALSSAGHLAYHQGDHPLARRQLEESVELWRELGGKQGLAHALRFLSAGVQPQGDYELVRSLAEESVELFREGSDTFGLTMSLGRLGSATLAQGDHAAAQSFLEEAVAICRETGDDWVLALTLRNLAIAAFRQGNYERAETLLKESLAVLQEPQEKVYTTQSLDSLAVVVSMHGEHKRAARLFGAAEALREAVGANVLPFYRADYELGVATARAGLGEEAFEEAWAQGRTMTPEEAIGYALQPQPISKEGSLHSQSSYPAGLSPRQAEVLRLVARGLTNSQIADELFISPHTVKRHLDSIYRKVGVTSRVAAARFASEHSLS
jgi:predicted ATPase/DNA-binding CsgD family transcriptional regulator